MASTRRSSRGPLLARRRSPPASKTKNRSVAYALRLALEEIRRLKEQPVPEDELAVNKDGIIEAFPSQWATRQAVANRFRGRGARGLARGLWLNLPEKNPGRHPPPTCSGWPGSSSTPRRW